MFKKHYLLIIASITVILIFSTISIYICNDSKNPSSDTKTDETSNKRVLPPDVRVNKNNFSLIFRFGYGGGGNVLDTFNNTFKHDMINLQPVMTSLSLSEEDLNKIYQKMFEIDFFNYPDIFSITGDGHETPYETYYFKVELNSNVKELLWEDDIPGEDIKAEKLIELIELIEDIIYSKAEYKELPEPVGGYE